VVGVLPTTLTFAIEEIRGGADQLRNKILYLDNN
jgi:hypothetical protein